MTHFGLHSKKQGRVLKLSPKSEQSSENVLKLSPKSGGSLKLNSV